MEIWGEQSQAEKILMRRWPENSGYLCFVIDKRSGDYLRLYHGQYKRPIYRIRDHLTQIFLGKAESLHHFIPQLGRGNRTAMLVRVWTMPPKLLRSCATGTKDINRLLLKNFLETLFCGVFRTLPQSTLVEYFGPEFTFESNYSGLGLNILPPIFQEERVAFAIRNKHRLRVRQSSDPEIQIWDQFRVGKFQSKSRLVAKSGSTPKADLKAMLTPILTRLGATISGDELVDYLPKALIPPLAGFSISQGFQSKLQGLEHCVLPRGDCTTSVGVVLDEMFVSSHDGSAETPWMLSRAGITTANSISWTYNHTSFGMSDQVQGQEIFESCLKFSKDIIEHSSIKVVLLCGEHSQDAIKKALNLPEPQVLTLRGQSVKIWIRERTQREPLPLPVPYQVLISMPQPRHVGLKKDSPDIHIFGEALKLTSILAGVALDCYYSERRLAYTTVYMQAYLESKNPDFRANMTAKNLDGNVQAFLFRKGFEEEKDIEELERITGSLARSICMLGHCFPPNPNKKEPGSFTVRTANKKMSEINPFPPAQLESVRELYDQIRRRKPWFTATKPGDVEAN